ncbi:glycosyltransferase family 2 protein [Chryseobacterium turcicum]|uniref:Glycosyltransferase family 2 protein n=1 Tax=Chryseobacterium turcicum TaxID=2898076 RepID=A0A9Q3V188_9FLAO|nr:glycosyltransferase family 2 protein [Chryseobacterium turcicum]MCD1116482.1 glycosyltransferase family 2 protein [Chryseobacterium turcicum]
MISIIIPVYNTEKYLHKCIDTVLSQSYKDIEVLLINDGSTDNSGKICDEYANKDGRIKIFHKENGGVSAARNLGIKKAKGEWLCFIDADDWIDADYLQNFVIVFSGEEDFIIQGYIKNNDEKIVGGSGFFSNFENFLDFFMYSEKNNLLNSPCFKLFRKDIVDRNNMKFDEKFSLGEDHIFTLEYIRFVSRFSVSFKRGYHYRMSNDGNSLTQKLIDIEKFKQYVLINNSLREEILNLNKAGKDFFICSYQEMNRWVIFTIHALFDKGRQLYFTEEKAEFESLLKLFRFKYGVSRISLKVDIYNMLFITIMRSGILPIKMKMKCLKFFTSIVSD